VGAEPAAQDRWVNGCSRTASRFGPKVKLPPEGRFISRITTSDMTSAPASASMSAAVREQGERVGEDADDHLDGHEADDQRERDREALCCGRCSAAATMTNEATAVRMFL
jgi:hypothetical protein